MPGRSVKEKCEEESGPRLRSFCDAIPLLQMVKVRANLRALLLTPLARKRKAPHRADPHLAGHVVAGDLAGELQG